MEIRLSPEKLELGLGVSLGKIKNEEACLKCQKRLRPSAPKFKGLDIDPPENKQNLWMTLFNLNLKLKLFSSWHS